MSWFFALSIALLMGQTAIAQNEVDPMSYLQFLAGKKWVIKDKMQQSSKTTNTGEVVFELELDKRILNFTKYYYLSANDLRPGTKGTFAINPFLGKIKQFTFSDDGQTTEGVVSEIDAQGFTIEYDKFLPDGQKMKNKEVFKKKGKDQLEVSNFSWDGSQWQAVSGFVWTRNAKKVAYRPVKKNGSHQPQYTFKPREWDVPVQFVADPKSKGLEFKSYTSDVNVYKHSYAYELLGGIKVNKMIVSKLNLKLVLFDKDGKVLLTKSDMTVNNFLSPSYRSGDVIPVKILKYTKNQALMPIAKAQLSVQTISKVAAAEKFTPSEKLPFTWGTRQPANVALEIRGRQNSVSASYKKGHRAYNFLLEVQNKGKLLIKGLVIRFEWLNEENKVIFAKKGYVATILNPPILPDVTRLYSITVNLPNTKVAHPERYRIVVDSVTL